MANPLMAQRQDSTSPLAGTFLLEDGEQLVGAFNSGSWVSGGMAAFAAVGDAASFIADPIGSLIAMGAGWVLEHVHPLDQWLDEFTGDADQVAAYAQTWGNINTQLSACSQQLAGYTRSDLSSMSGQTISAITALEADLGKLIEQAGKWASAMGQALNVAATLVQIVHDLVRDALSEIIGKFASAIIEAVATAGLGIPAIAAQISTSVATMTSRISTTVHKVIDSVKNLKGLLGKLTELFRKFSDTFNRLLREGADAPVNTKGLDVSSVHSPKGAHPTTGPPVPEPHTRASELPRTKQEFDQYNIDLEHSDPLLKDTDAEWGRKPDHTPYTENEWTHEFVDPQSGYYKYPDPPYVPGTKVRMGLDEFTATYGTSIDRIGEPRGKWLAAAPDGVPVSFESRALPHESLAKPHYSYTVSSLPEGCTFEVSTVAPGFGYSGGATQIQVFNSKGEVLTVKEMIKQGILK